MGDPQAYKWAFDRSSCDSSSEFRTFSVGIYQWLPKTSGKGSKKSTTIRVLGYVAEPEAVYAKARELCDQFNREKVCVQKLPAWVRKQYSVPQPKSTTRKTQTVNDLVSRMMREVMGPEMKRRGFRITRKTFWRDNGKQCQVISLRLSGFGTAAKSQLFVELGVYWREVEALLGDASAMPPPERACTFRYSLGHLYSGRQGIWRVQRSTDFATLGNELVGAIVKYGLPWLEYRCATEYVLKPFVPKGPWNCTAAGMEMTAWARVVFLAKCGRIDEAKRILEGWQSAIGSEYERRIQTLARRLGIVVSRRASRTNRVR